MAPCQKHVCNILFDDLLFIFPNNGSTNMAIGSISISGLGSQVIIVPLIMMISDWRQCIVIIYLKREKNRKSIVCPLHSRCWIINH